MQLTSTQEALFTPQQLLESFLSTCEDLFSHEATVLAAQHVEGDTDKWEALYDLVFSDNGSVRIRKLLRAMGYHLDYYDPDTSYQEDVQAYLAALHEKYDDFRKHLVGAYS